MNIILLMSLLPDPGRYALIFNRQEALLRLPTKLGDICWMSAKGDFTAEEVHFCILRRPLISRGFLSDLTGGWQRLKGFPDHG